MTLFTSTLDKNKVHKSALELLNQKISNLQVELDMLQQGLGASNRSTAGDKHETSRAMLHLEQEQLGRQLEPLIKMKSILGQIDPSESHDGIVSGSLIQTNNGNFYLSVGLGEIQIENERIFCLSPSTPLGKAFLDQVSSREIDFNGKVYQIIKVS